MVYRESVMVYFFTRYNYLRSQIDEARIITGHLLIDHLEMLQRIRELP